MKQGELVLTYDDGMVVRQDLFDKLSLIYPGMGGRMETVNKVFWICNPVLATLFEAALDSVELKHQINPTEFLSQDWKLTTDLPYKEAYIRRFEELKSPLSSVWNAANQVSLAPCCFPVGMQTVKQCVFSLFSSSSSDS